MFVDKDDLSALKLDFGFRDTGKIPRSLTSAQARSVRDRVRDDRWPDVPVSTTRNARWSTQNTVDLSMITRSPLCLGSRGDSMVCRWIRLHGRQRRYQKRVSWKRHSSAQVACIYHDACRERLFHNTLERLHHERGFGLTHRFVLPQTEDRTLKRSFPSYPRSSQMDGAAAFYWYVV